MEGTKENQVKRPLTGEQGSCGTIVITGATGSMGKVATQKMAQDGWTVIMACRNTRKAEEAKADILQAVPDARLEVMLLDLSSQQSIRDFVLSLNGRRIDALFCNAGYMARRHELSADGFEMDMATNYLGNKLLCELIIPLMPAGGHIVNMVSLTAKYAHLDDNWQQWPVSRFSQLGTYASSKLALLRCSDLLAKAHPQLHINVADPGIVDSNMITMGRWFDPLANLFFRPFIKTPEQGVYPALQALHTEETDMYFVGKKVKPISC